MYYQQFMSKGLAMKEKAVFVSEGSFINYLN